MKRIIFLLAASIILTGCFLRNEARRQLFDNNDCSAPCFLSITPGRTLEEDAKIIIRSNELIRDCQEYDSTLQGGIRGIECESVGMVFEGGFVTQIGYSPLGVSLDEVINKYGSPEKIVVTKVNLPEESIKVKASLWFGDIHTQITLPETKGDIYAIRPNIQIESISYYSQEEYDKITDSTIDMVLWQGYISYPGKLP